MPGLTGDNLESVVRNGSSTTCYPGCVNLSFSCVDGESLLMALKDVALSSGSACTSASLEPSYVLRAIGADEDLAHSSIRLGHRVLSLVSIFFNLHSAETSLFKKNQNIISIFVKTQTSYFPPRFCE